MVPFTRVPFWVPFFDPQPFEVFRVDGVDPVGLLLPLKNQEDYFPIRDTFSATWDLQLMEGKTLVKYMAEVRSAGETLKMSATRRLPLIFGPSKWAVFFPGSEELVALGFPLEGRWVCIGGCFFCFREATFVLPRQWIAGKPREPVAMFLLKAGSLGSRGNGTRLCTPRPTHGAWGRRGRRSQDEKSAPCRFLTVVSDPSCGATESNT